MPNAATDGSSPRPIASMGWAGAPLFLAVCCFALGIVAARFLLLRPSWLLLAMAPLALLSALAAFRALRIRWIPLSFLWALAGCWCALMQPQPAPDAQLAALSDGLLRTVEGQITEARTPRLAQSPVQEEPAEGPPRAEPPAQSFDLQLGAIEELSDTRSVMVPAQGKLRLTVRWPRGDLQPFACGERLRAVVRLLPPTVYRDPGAWSRAEYLLDQGVTASASLEAGRVERLGYAPQGSASCWLSNLRRELSARMLALPEAMRALPRPLRLSEDDAIMLTAMTTGDRTQLRRGLRISFERTGSFHMLVVSGFHLAIVAGCLFWIAGWMRLPRVAATVLTLALSLGYALFTGFATPVQRSFWMVALYLLVRLLYRERQPLNAIGFAAICLLAANPRSLFDAGFQMTLLAVVSIAGFATPLLQATVHPYLAATRQLKTREIDRALPPLLAQFRVELRMLASALELAVGPWLGWRCLPWMVRSLLRVVELLAVSLVVELAMTLAMAVDFHRITLFALPVNMLILPLLSVLMPAALATLLLLAFWPAAALWAAVAAGLLLHAGVGMIHLFGALELGDMRIPTPLPWQTAAFYALVAATVFLAMARRPRLLGASLALTLAAVAAVLPRPLERPRAAMLVESIDVGQGDSTLVISPEGRTLLVDGGGLGGGARPAVESFDVGEEVVSPALWARGLRRLDAVALTHAHADHMGGLPAVLRNFRPRELWVGDNPPAASYLALLEEARALGVVVRSLRAGDRFAFGGAELYAMAPARAYHPGPAPANNDSLVLHLSYRKSAAQLEGDAEGPVEESMLADPALPSTLLKVGHHGSASATRPEFLARVAPRLAVISCGRRNRFGHPRPEVLAELQAARVRTYSTDLLGASCFVLDGEGGYPLPNCDRNESR